ncbi:hypothetical protein I7I53_08893 [Histoplasma capsulatum var. duboisii H88]|uniref:Uncharacterized protein n=1 Tax=Ajellomyces capsulatus (strain H88) TaxID=544711 RepID=A0A8A1L5V4_AJEC8|nr:hypothetical protein I7I53_08893 [Histoplasma capsulatum var. duboisii H88]
MKAPYPQLWMQFVVLGRVFPQFQNLRALCQGVICSGIIASKCAVKGQNEGKQREELMAVQFQSQFVLVHSDRRRVTLIAGPAAPRCLFGRSIIFKSSCFSNALFPAACIFIDFFIFWLGRPIKRPCRS